MKPETFVRWAEDYYGKYRPVVKAELTTWLSAKPPHLIAGLRERVRDEYSNQYRMPPDIALLKPLSSQQETYDRGRRIMELASEKQDQKMIEQGELGRGLVGSDAEQDQSSHVLTESSPPQVDHDEWDDDVQEEEVQP